MKPQTRSFELAEIRQDGEAPGGLLTLTGRAVPYETPTHLWDDLWEVIARDAVEVPDAGVVLIYRHGEPIGVVTSHEHREDGWWITATISDTALGRDAATLVRDGAIKKLSIGFVPHEWSDEHAEDGTITRRHTRITVREVSLVPFPAYEDATITDHRHAKEEPMPTTATPAVDLAADLAETRAQLTEVSRTLDALRTTGLAPAPQQTETRSVGELLKAAVAGEESASQYLSEMHTRSYTGGTLADSLGDDKHPGALVDLIRLVEAANPFAAEFSSGALPETGEFIEFARLKTNTLQVNEQVNEGDEIATGKIQLEASTEKIKTFAGGATLSRKQIDRWSINTLNLSLRGMAIKAGDRAAANLATKFEAVVKSQTENALSLTKEASALTWADLASLFVDAAMKFHDQALPVHGLAVTPATFKALAALQATDGTPLLTVSGTGTNRVGEVNPLALSAEISHLRIVPHLKATRDGMGTGIVGAFYNRDALRQYKSPLVRLQDQAIFTLTGDFAVYYYEAVVDEMPAAIIPLKLGA